MATGSIRLLMTHWLSHWVSCGHTRPHTDGRMLASRMTPRAPSTSFTRRWRMKRGMSISTGQPLMHVGRLHCRQRSASRSASLSVYPSDTSSNVRDRAAGSRTAIGTRVGSISRSFL